MELNDFSDLSGFMYQEYEKLTETLGLDKVPKRSVKFIEKSIRKYTKLYDKPLYAREQRELAVRTAIETMPHGWLWKIFHSKLWARVKIALAQEQQYIQQAKDIEAEKPAEKPDILVPAVIVPHDVAIIPQTQDTSEFDSDFDCC